MPVSKSRKRKQRKPGTAKAGARGQLKLTHVAALVGLAIVVVLAGAVIYTNTVKKGALVTVSVPELSAEAAEGGKVFAAHCAECHGANAAGSGKGPPLVHRYYEPNHHGDSAILLAVRRGVQQHHWRFGDMPPVTGVSDRQAALVVRYLRALQRANGIY